MFFAGFSCQIVIHSDGGFCAECFCPCLEGVFKSANLIEVWRFPKVGQRSVVFCRIVAVCVHHFRSVLLNEYICPVALLATRIETQHLERCGFQFIQRIVIGAELSHHVVKIYLCHNTKLKTFPWQFMLIFAA